MFAIASRVQPAYTADPDTESGVGGRIVGWWKADTISDPGDGNPVATWPDESDTGADVTAAGAARPTYRAASSNSTKLPVVEWDGSANHMTSGIEADLQLQSDMTTIMMVKMDDVTAQFETLIGVGGTGSGSAENLSWLLQIDTRRLRHVHEVGSQSGVVNNTVTSEPVDDQKLSTGWTAIAVRRTIFGSEEMQWWQNSEIYTKTGSIGTPTGGSNGIVSFGSDPSGGAYFTGQMAEVIVFNEALSSAEIKAYFRYLNDKWLPKLFELDLFDGKATELENPESVDNLSARFSPESEKLTWTGSVLRTAEDLEEIDIWRSSVNPNSVYLGQSTNSRNPRLRAGFLNNYNVVEFSPEASIGSPGNDWLTTDDNDRGGIESVSGATMEDIVGTGDFTIFAVLAQRVQGIPWGFDTNPNDRHITPTLDQQSGPTFYWDVQPTTEANNVTIIAQSPVVQTDSEIEEGVDDIPWHILQIRSHQGNIYIKVDEGPEYESESSMASVFTGRFWIGTGTLFTQNQSWSGYMADWISYDVHLSRETCANIRAFLANKYDLY